MNEEQEKKVSEINDRVGANPSFGFSFTHYQGDVRYLLNLVRELESENGELKSQLESVCSSGPCPKCGAGVRVACYGCENKALRFSMEKARKALLEGKISEALTSFTESLDKVLEGESPRVYIAAGYHQDRVGTWVRP